MNSCQTARGGGYSAKYDTRVLSNELKIVFYNNKLNISSTELMSKCQKMYTVV